MHFVHKLVVPLTLAATALGMEQSTYLGRLTLWNPLSEINFEYMSNALKYIGNGKTNDDDFVLEAPVLFACPESACPGGKCPSEEERVASGCLVNEQHPSRAVSSLNGFVSVLEYSLILNSNVNADVVFDRIEKSSIYPGTLYLVHNVRSATRLTPLPPVDDSSDETTATMTLEVESPPIKFTPVQSMMVLSSPEQVKFDLLHKAIFDSCNKVRKLVMDVVVDFSCPEDVCANGCPETVAQRAAAGCVEAAVTKRIILSQEVVVSIAGYRLVLEDGVSLEDALLAVQQELLRPDGLFAGTGATLATPQPIFTSSDSSCDDGCVLAISLSVSLGAALIIVIVAAICCWRRKHSSDQPDDTEENKIPSSLPDE
eukprot:TRINITY_DN8088_c0_g1_i1.p1 TRINITY_DN8088_c0_g1~~TRINITY_DN8088_c0_g1_i1.p1  ORF type:complete len:384 (+),score=77.47 TRINITY_DN8088_c0_g1_i1:41-1153(+)